jgi:hypothetical protein
MLVCRLLSLIVSLFRLNMGLAPIFFANNLGLKVLLFASPPLTVCGPLQLAVEEGAKGLTPAEQFYALAA